jgi:parallel beta-helix repeat protein
MANYLVGPNQLYKEVQNAINALFQIQGTTEFTEQHNITIVEEGIYSAFEINPIQQLKPTSTYRLVIGAANGILPIIDATKTEMINASFMNGCLIADAVSYVTIRRMYFRGFQKGIVVGPNCHNTIIEKNVILNSENVGVWVYQSDRCQIINNVVFNAKYGIVSTLVKDFAVIYNTVFNDQFASTGKDTCLYIGLQKDRGNLDHGKATIYNNLLYSMAGRTILINQRDLLNLQSDFNNLYAPNDSVATIREELSNGTVNLTEVEDLDSWYNQSYGDSLSISDDPVFIVQNTNVNASAIDLSLLAASPCIAAAKLLCGDPTNDLDLYIDDSLLCSDVLGKDRGSAPTIGANEINVTEGFYGTTVTTDINLQNANLPACAEGAVLSHIDAVSEQYQSSVNCWVPQIKSGFFYVREKPYYLYADKKGYTLKNLRQTIFIMPRPIIDPILYVSGKSVTNKNYYEIHGDKFLLKHRDLDITSEADIISIQGKVRIWSSDHEKFTNRVVVYRFRIMDGERRYVFPEEPKDSAPIVITDDTIRPLDPSSFLPHEFYTEAGNDGIFLKFHQDQNLVLNPQFEYGNTVSDAIADYGIDTSDFQYVTNPFLTYQDTTGANHDLNDPYSTNVNDPLNMYLSEQFVARTLGSTTFIHVGAEVPHDYILKTDGRISSRSFIQVSGSDPVYPLMGKNMLVFDVPTGLYLDHYIAQEVSYIDPDKNYYFSLYAAAPNKIGKIYFDLNTYDGNNVLLQQHTGYSADIASSVELNSADSHWKRLGISIGNVAAVHPASRYVVTGVNADTSITNISNDMLSLNSEARKVQFRIYSETGNPVAIDCLQFEEGDQATRYSRIPKESDVTVEYDSTNSGFYEVDDLTIAPLRNVASNGFLQIGPVPASDFDENAPYNSTTLTDWFWSNGRTKYLPWAKTNGKNKFARTRHKHDSGVFCDNDITWDLDIPTPSQIISATNQPACLQDSEAEFLSIKILDSNGNAYTFKNISLEIFSVDGIYPGAIVHRELGIPDKYGQSVDIITDSDGCINVFIEAPASEDTQYFGNKPDVFSSATFPANQAINKQFASIEIDYPASLDNYGNIVVRDRNLVSYDLEADTTLTRTITPSHFSGGLTVYNLNDYAAIGSIVCKISNLVASDTTLKLTEQSIPEYGEFIYDPLFTRILLQGNEPRSIQVTYNRMLAWVNPDSRKTINIDKTVLDQITGDIMINYDAEINLKITANAPDRVAGIPAKYKMLKITARNPFKNTVACQG